MIGDCTLASYPKIRFWDIGFENVVGENWAYPFSNTSDIFAADELTIANLECSVSDLPGYSNITFRFLAPKAATQILTLGGVDAVTAANNHALDFGPDMLRDTVANMESAGIPAVTEGEGKIVESPNGLRIGIYADFNGHYPNSEKVAAGVRSLLEQGAEVVVVSLHWGDEASYYVNAYQEQTGHAAIDAGATVVMGHGPHRLEPYEEYRGSVIFYSLANFVFGGNTEPKDMDTAIGQITVTRQDDGSFALSGFRAIPCSISSTAPLNNYCPTPMEEDTEEYRRAMSKVDGTWTGANNNIDYSVLRSDS